MKGRGARGQPEGWLWMHPVSMAVPHPPQSADQGGDSLKVSRRAPFLSDVTVTPVWNGWPSCSVDEVASSLFRLALTPAPFPV